MNKIFRYQNTYGFMLLQVVVLGVYCFYLIRIGFQQIRDNSHFAILAISGGEFMTR